MQRNLANALAVIVLALGTTVAKADGKDARSKPSAVRSPTQTGVITARPRSLVHSPVLYQTYNGKGMLTGTGMVSVNGTIIPATYKGTYTVNPDCAGSYTVQVSPLDITGHGFFVISDT